MLQFWVKNAVIINYFAGSMFPRIYYLIYKSLVCVLFAVFCIQANACAQKIKDDPRIARLNSLSNIDSVKHFGDSLLKVAQDGNDKPFEGKVLFALSYKFYRNGQELVALKYATNGAAVATPADSNTYVHLQTMIAWMQSRGGNSKQGLQTAFAILRVAEKHGWKKLQIECKSCISDLYRPLKDRKSSIFYAKQAADESLAIKDTASFINAQSFLAYAYVTEDSFYNDDSKEELAKAVHYLEVLLNKPFESKLGVFQKVNIMGNLGTFYQKQGRSDDAERITRAAYAIAKEKNFWSLQKHQLNELMTISIKKKNFTKAISYGEQALAVQNEANSSRKLQGALYSRLTEAYAGARNFEKAYEFSEKASRLNDTLLADDQRGIAAKLDKKYKADKTLLQASHKNKLLVQQRNFIIALGAMGLLALFGLYRWFVYRKRKEAAIMQEQHRQMEQLDAMKSRFFANISHELKTPLTLIMGPAEQLLSTENVSAEQQTSLRTIARNSKRLLDIVNELLDLGKMESEAIALRPSVVNLNELINLIVQGFASAAEHKKIVYTQVCDIDKQLLVSIDRDKFEKIANNLLSNAIKFTGAGQLVNVAASVAGDDFTFSVTDSGTGIHPEDVTKIFDRYYQGRQEYRAEGGTGIGLSIAREFTELMGGTIKLENDYGYGTKFTVNIPLVIATKMETAPVDSTFSATTSQPLSGKRARILLVEDHEEMAGYIAGILRPRYGVTITGDGVAALEQLAGDGPLPDLIISDVMMPVMDGFTLLDKLKQHPQYFRIPVILLTALADSANKLKALNIGVDDYLTKPFLKDELLARVNNLVSNAANRTAVLSLANDDDDDEALEEEESVDTEEVRQLSPSDLVWLSSLEETARKFIGKTDLNLDLLADEMAISERQLFRRIKNITGLTPNKYIRTIRLQIAREAIESGRYRTVAEVSYAAGFETPAYFSKLFKEHFGRDVSGLI